MYRLCFPYSYVLSVSLLSVCVPPPGSEYDDEEVDYEESDSDESWTTESAISSESILSSMCMNGGEEKPFACPVPGCKKRYKVQYTLSPCSLHCMWYLAIFFCYTLVIYISVQYSL
jgi:hypothetical protein